MITWQKQHQIIGKSRRLTNTNGKWNSYVKCFHGTFLPIRFVSGRWKCAPILQHWLIWSTNKTLLRYHPSSHGCTHSKTSPFTTSSKEPAISWVNKVWEFKWAYMHHGWQHVWYMFRSTHRHPTSSETCTLVDKKKALKVKK